ncbi:MAG: hypothetical protein IJ766_09075 [Clostridia bacterium]|nr:hypothetical protein [Clostridia bacterium]
MIFAVYLYLSLRRYRWWALLCALDFVGYHVFGFMTLNYYNMINMAALLVCILLFVKEKVTIFDYVFAGFVYACGVLIEPATAVIYFVFSLLVLIKLIRQKKDKAFLPACDFIFNGRAWGLLTAGILICAVIFFVIILAGADIKALLINLPELAGDYEYNYVTGVARVIKWYKLENYLKMTGIVSNILWTGYFIALLIFRRKLQEKKLAFFSIGCAIYAYTVISLLVMLQKDLFVVYIYDGLSFSIKTVLISLLGTVCYVLSTKKNRKLFAFLLYGWSCALLTDFTSDVSIGFACVVSAIPSILLFAGLVRELISEKLGCHEIHSISDAVRHMQGRVGKKRLKLQFACVTLALIVLVMGESYSYASARTWHFIEIMVNAYYQKSETLDAELTQGPLQGVVTIPFLKVKYDETLEDLALIKQASDGPLYVADLCSWYYLYADMPYGTYSAYFVDADSRDRLEHYWDLHPDKRPQVIYVPFFNYENYREDKERATANMQYFRSRCACTVQIGKQGYIIAVTDWEHPQT